MITSNDPSPNDNADNANTTTSTYKKKENKMTEEDELIIKIVSAGAIVVFVLICIGFLIRSVR
jgi:hypothetical protein